MYGLPKIEGNEWWKKLVFGIIAVLTVVVYVYQIMLCVWIIFWTPLEIWRIESLILIFLSLFFALTEVIALILSLADATKTSCWMSCVMITYIVWLGLLLLCTIFTIIMVLVSQEQIADQYMYGALFSLVNLILMLLSSILYYCFFYKTAVIPYQLVSVQPWAFTPRYAF